MGFRSYLSLTTYETLRIYFPVKMCNMGNRVVCITQYSIYFPYVCTIINFNYDRAKCWRRASEWSQQTPLMA